MQTTKGGGGTGYKGEPLAGVGPIVLVHFAINTVLQSVAVPDARARAGVYQSEVQNLRPCITRQSGKGVALFVAIGMRRHKLLFIGVVDVGWSGRIPHTIVEVIVGCLFAFSIESLLQAGCRRKIHGQCDGFLSSSEFISVDNANGSSSPKHYASMTQTGYYAH